ncbi:MAG: aspartate--tRNA ligase [Candidatus Omnitrophica bacterium]|nr:aspartate--tRNA ligase [Candidatus Omnitrophota bacterium]
MKRTHTCGELNVSHVGQQVTLCGWVGTRRDHGGLIFIDVRDREGLTQVVFNPQNNPELHESAKGLKSEYVVSIHGEVRNRPPGTENMKLPTGVIELIASKLDILNVSETPPFQIDAESHISEDLRLIYRYMDLRRPFMQKNLFTRHRVCKLIRDYLDKTGFIEVETPVLTKSTPEGARDYLVPSRVNPGKFYALPQSPQLFKQILMVAGFEKYFQIARCFRDEDLRADRQPEFTQLDIEMSFIDEEDIYCLIEGLISEIFKSVLDLSLKTPFDRLTYKECMSRFGTDKPDMRFGLEIVDISDSFRKTNFKIYRNILSEGGVLKCINAKGGSSFSHSEIDDFTKYVNIYGARGLSWFKVADSSMDSPIAKFFDQEILKDVHTRMKAETGDILFVVADKEEKVALESLGNLRLFIADKLKLVNKKEFKFLWVTDFPLFKYNVEEKRWESEHHPFTSPKDEDAPLLDTEPGKVRSRAYDLIINGTEIGGGSIRIHGSSLQEKIFGIIGLERKDALAQFGFLLNAFKYGAPPHGGIALGIDRLITMLLHLDSIRDVIAFPKSQKATCLMTEAPSDVSSRQLKELHLAVKE